MKKRVLVLALLFGISPALVFADSLPVDAANLVGVRTTPAANGVIGLQSWAPTEGGFRIAWNISFSSGLWHYTYNLTDLDGTPLDQELSHWLLEVSSNFTTANIVNNSHTYELNTYNAGPSNPNLPGPIYGLKFESSGPAFSFDSDRAPMWGDFYAISGHNTDPPTSAWNTGFGTDPASGTSTFTNWIAVPNTTTTAIPEPSSVLLVAAGLLALAVRSRVRPGK
jgi:hypothetical protein